MAVRAAPKAPSRAAADPPPGAGASEASRPVNPATVCSLSFMASPPYSSPIRWYSITCRRQSKSSSFR